MLVHVHHVRHGLCCCCGVLGSGRIGGAARRQKAATNRRVTTQLKGKAASTRALLADAQQSQPVTVPRDWRAWDKGGSEAAKRMSAEARLQSPLKRHSKARCCKTSKPAAARHQKPAATPLFHLEHSSARSTQIYFARQLRPFASRALHSI
eukprot:6196379-Pleurochrysis_carterae.AAC.7